MSRLLNLVLTVLLACSLFDQSDKPSKRETARDDIESKLALLMSTQIKPQYSALSRTPASPEPPTVDQTAFAFAVRDCEFNDRCGAAKALSARRGLFDVAIQFARIECERTGEPCFDAGVYAREAGYNEETVFWNVVGFCTKSIGDVSCNQLKMVGYDEESFLDFLEIPITKRTRGGGVTSRKVQDVLFQTL